MTLESITSLVSPALPQLAIAELLESGFYSCYVRRLRLRLADQVQQYIQCSRVAAKQVVGVDAPRCRMNVGRITS